MPHTARTLLAAVGLLLHDAAAQQWEQVQPATRPPAAIDAKMAFDLSRATTVWFGGTPSLGGSPAPAPLGQVWLRQNGVWSQAAPTASPPARSQHAMCYYPNLNAVVVFGGVDASNSPLNDIWWYDGQTWQTTYYSNAPVSRVGAAMAAGDASGMPALLVFGGWSPVQGHLNDTWTWHPQTGWSQFQTPAAGAPVPRRDAAMAAGVLGPPLPWQNTLLLHGGTAVNQQVLADSWWWNGSAWQLLPAAGGPPRTRHALAFHPASGRTFLSGGADANGAEAELWRWERSRWVLVPTAVQPTAAVGAAIAFDSDRDRLVAVGGGLGQPPVSAGNEHWEYEPPLLSALVGGSCANAPVTVSLMLALHAGRGESWGALVRVSWPNSMTWTLFAVGFDDAAWNGVPLPLSLGALGLPQCQLRVDPAWTTLRLLQQAGQTTYADFQIAIPDVASLYGLPLFAQAIGGDATGARFASAAGAAEVW